MAILNFTLPKPRNDDDWELWCKKIFASIYKVPEFQRYEIRGKNQKGIDLFAKLDDGKIVVVQCKRRSTAKALTEDEAEIDYRAALKLEPRPDHFIIATTHDKKGLQDWALNQSDPTAAVYAWSDFEDRFATDESLRAALYGTADVEVIRKVVEKSIAETKSDAASASKDARAVWQAVVDQPLAEADEFADAYVNHVTEALDELDLFGVDLPKEARKYRLSVAYISLNLESGSGEQETGPQAAASVLAKEGNNRLIIRGDAGSGKSTLLKWAAIRCRGARWEHHGNRCSAAVGPILMNRIERESKEDPFQFTMEPKWNSASYSGTGQITQIHYTFDAKMTSLPWWLRTPFIIRLRDCAAGKLPPISDFAKMTANLPCSTPKGWEESVFKAGRGLVFLDGIDEVPPKYRVTLHKQIKALIKHFPDNMYVLTTRPLSEGEPEWLDELGFQQARVAPMARVDREACIDRWHKAIAEELERSNRPDHRVAALPAKLKAALNDTPEIARLATNPLMCAMICALHRSKNHLPENLNELLEALCMILLYSREKETPEFNLKEFDPKYADLSYEDRKAIVSHLAKYMVMEGESAMPRSLVKKKIGEALLPLKDRSPADAEVVLQGLLERSGMLREKTASTIDFIHNTFKEYLAAVRFLDGHEVKTLAKQAHEAGWDNVAVFAAAAAVRDQDFSDQLVSEMLPTEAAKDKALKKRRKVYKDPKAIDANDAKRYKRAVTAVRVVSAIRTKLKPETQRRYEAMKRELFPPRSLADAAGLATAGNAVLKFVSMSPRLTPTQRVRCVRTLRLIGTPEATERLRGFCEDDTIEVIEELALAIDPFEIRAVVECYTETAESLKARQDRNRREWIRSLTQTQIRTCAALQGRGRILRLDLGRTQIMDEELAALANQNSGLKALTALHLSDTNVTDAGVAALADKNTVLTVLSELYLSQTKVTDEGVKALASSNTGLKALTTLNLSGTPVTDAGVTAIARADTCLKALTTLVLANTKVTDAGVAVIAHSDTGLKALTTLSLSETKVTDGGIRALADKNTGLKALTTLNLFHTKVTDAGVAALVEKNAGLTFLNALHLSKTQVTDEGVKALASNATGLRFLTTLNLANTQVTDEGVKALASNTTGLRSLTTLNLANTQVTDAGLAALADKHTGLKALTTLTLSNTQVTDAGVAALADKHTGLKSLTTLNFNYTSVTAEGVAAFKRRFPDFHVHQLGRGNLDDHPQLFRVHL